MGKNFEERQKYIHNMARTLMGRLKVKPEDWLYREENALHWLKTPARRDRDAWKNFPETVRVRIDQTVPVLASALFERYKDELGSILNSWSAAKKGEIIECGVQYGRIDDGHLRGVDVSICWRPGYLTPSYYVQKQLPIMNDGSYNLLFLSIVTLVAAITDNLFEDFSKIPKEPAEFTRPVTG